MCNKVYHRGRSFHRYPAHLNFINFYYFVHSCNQDLLFVELIDYFCRVLFKTVLDDFNISTVKMEECSKSSYPKSVI